MSWNIAQAKQRFSEVVRQAAEEPQLIYNRDHLVAAVIDAEDFEAFKQWRERTRQRTLADEFAELRQILREENYQLEIPPRVDRPNAFVERLEEEEREFYSSRAPQEWLDALSQLGTDADKPFLETAPYLVVIFSKSSDVLPDGTKIKTYYASESTGIATGFLINAIHNAGLVCLTYTPNREES